MRLVVGCDGGGTKCAALGELLREDGSLVRACRVSAGAANVRSNPEQARESLREVTREIRHTLRVPPDHPIDMLVAALAGAGQPDVQRQWQLDLSPALGARVVRVVPDVVAVFAATDIPPTEFCIATVVGTGSIAWARHPHNGISRSGGLGPDVGDEGSGYWMGCQALQRCQTSGDRSEALATRIRVRTEGVNMTVHQTAELARDLFELQHQDPTAAEILDQAAHHIARLVANVGSAASQRHAPVAWICAGGVAVHHPTWLEQVRLLAASLGVELAPPVLVPEPACGALHLAKSHLARN